MLNPFFKNYGPFNIKKILELLNVNLDGFPIQEINNISDLNTATVNDITFLHSKKYIEIAKLTKASFCITTNNLKTHLPNNCSPIVVENVLISTSQVTAKFYPTSVNDDFDDTVIDINEIENLNSVKFGKNILIGKNVSIGSNCLIGHNTIIEKNVSIGNNCSIGSNTIIRNTLIGNNVKILDNCTIGKHGFGFFPNNKKNLRYPHIGIVLIEDNCEIGCGATIDRGLYWYPTSTSATYDPTVGLQISLAIACSRVRGRWLPSPTRTAGPAGPWVPQSAHLGASLLFFCLRLLTTRHRPDKRKIPS